MANDYDVLFILSIDGKIIGCTTFSNTGINHLPFHIGLCGGQWS